MCALSLRADIDGRDSLDGYRNRSRYYQGIAHEVPIRAVARDGDVLSGSFASIPPFQLQVGLAVSSRHAVSSAIQQPAQISDSRTPATGRPSMMRHPSGLTVIAF